MSSILYFFTKALASGIALLKTAVRGVLPNLYIINQNDDENISLIYSGDYPSLYPQAYGEYLDLLGYMFGVSRLSDESDDAYRQRILFSLSRNSTPNGIKSAVSFLLKTKEIESEVIIVNNFNNFFDAQTTSFDYPMRDYRGSLLYSVNIFIKPKILRQNFIYEPQGSVTPTNPRIIRGDDGNPITSTYGDFIKLDLLNNETFDKIEPIYYNYFENVFNVDSFQMLLDDITAAGIRVESVTFLEPGAGGAKGESYAYPN